MDGFCNSPLGWIYRELIKIDFITDDKGEFFSL